MQAIGGGAAMKQLTCDNEDCSNVQSIDEKKRHVPKGWYSIEIATETYEFETKALFFCCKDCAFDGILKELG